MNVAPYRYGLLQCFLVVFAISTPATAQSLVQNGGFEQYTTCPQFKTGDTNHGWNSSMYPSGWQMPTDGTPDLITDCNATCDYLYTPNPAAYYPQVCYADNIFGCQNPRTGNGSNHAYMGITMVGSNNQFSQPDFREYLQTTLTPSAGLVAGQCYHLTYYVSRADMSSRATTMQAVITKNPLTNLNNNFAGVLTPPSDAIFLSKHQPYRDKLAWTQVDFDFIATGGEKYLTIGFFEDQSSPYIVTDYGATTCSSTSCMPNSAYLNGNNTVGYYYIDDVVLFATASPQFTNTTTFSNTNLSGTYTNQNIILNGAITVNNNLTFTGCTIKCTSGTTITVQSTKTLTLDNTRITAGCNHMWEGIAADVLSSITMKNTSSISDAVTAIRGQSVFLQIDKSSFLANENDIVIDQPIQSSYVKGTTFNHTIQLNDQAYGVGGYGITGITLKNYTGTLTVGGPNTADICFFYGGQYGIKAENANLTVHRCYCDGIKQIAIDFQGNAPNNAIRSLTVTASTFVNNKRHIFSQHKTNLTVTYSSLINAQAHAIEWSDNHDCHLLLGDSLIPQSGNYFAGNAWSAVTAVDNRTSFSSSNIAFATTQLGAYTTIAIANNQIIAPPYAAGLLIGEWTFGGAASYHSLNITHNTMNDATKGIQLYNVEGWGGTLGANPPSGIPAQGITGNMIYTTTAQTATAFGIKLGNTWGYNVSENGVSSDNCGNYLNRGLTFENSPYTEIRENIISAGTCITSGSDMLGSNIHCNLLANYAVGISLAWTYLRDSAVLHGSVTEQFNNATNAGIPWNEDISVYNSQVNHNQWVWNYASNFLTITYSGNTGNGSIISTTTGVDKCNQILSPVYPLTGGMTHIEVTNDPVAQWRADYCYEIQRARTGSGDSTIASANIKAIIHIEELISTQQYSEALSALGAFNPTNITEQHYKTVLAILANSNYPTKRELTATEISSLRTIATQHARTAGTAVTLARLYLAAKYNLYFDDETYSESDVYGTAEIKTPCSLAPAAETTLDLMDADGNALDITGTKIETDGGFTFDPHQLAYYSNQNPHTPYRIYAKHGSQYTVVNKEFHTIADWINASSINLDLSGVSVLKDSVTTTEYMQIDTYTTMTDGAGNSFTVGTTSGSSDAHFLIEKRDAVGDLLWSRTWNGPVSGNDSATCMYLDTDGNVYVAGKVWNGKSYDCQALKYDTDGYLVWSSLLADAHARENTPSGIMVDPADGSVHITGTSREGAHTEYRYVHYWQCLPSGHRTGNPEETETIEAPTDKIVQFYPNPSGGNLYVNLAEESGGQLELTDLVGKTVLSLSIVKSENIQFPDNVVSGTYFITFTTANGSQIIDKVIIIRD